MQAVTWRLTAEQLRNVVSNRAPRDRGQPLGKLLPSVIDRLRRQETGPALELLQALGECGDDDFLIHCSFGSLRAGVLTLLVDREALVQPLRQRWVRTLLHRVSRVSRFSIRSIRFQYGRSDFRFPAGGQPSD